MLYHRNVMKKGKTKTKIRLFGIVVLALLIAVCAFTAARTFSEKKASESFSEVDYYSMQYYSDKNVEVVFSTLKSGKLDKLKKRMISSDGLDELAEFANWSEADFSKAVGLGSGSLSAAPDDAGRMDMSERFFVDVGDTKYVLMVETVTSRWGRTDEGISAVAATTYSHFDKDLDYNWSGEADDESVLAGELFWKGNQPAEDGGDSSDKNEEPNT